MSLTQVSTWFANARRRLKKEKGWFGNDDDSNDNDNSKKEGDTENSKDSEARTPCSSTQNLDHESNGNVESPCSNSSNSSLLNTLETPLPSHQTSPTTLTQSAAALTPPYTTATPVALEQKQNSFDDPTVDGGGGKYSLDPSQDKKIWSIVSTATNSFSPPPLHTKPADSTANSLQQQQQHHNLQPSFRVISKPGQSFPDPLANPDWGYANNGGYYNSTAVSTTTGSSGYLQSSHSRQQNPTSAQVFNTQQQQQQQQQQQHLQQQSQHQQQQQQQNIYDVPKYDSLASKYDSPPPLPKYDGSFSASLDGSGVMHNLGTADRRSNKMTGYHHSPGYSPYPVGIKSPPLGSPKVISPTAPSSMHDGMMKSYGNGMHNVQGLFSDAQNLSLDKTL